MNPNIDTDDLISIKEDNIFINIPNERITYKINRDNIIYINYVEFIKYKDNEEFNKNFKIIEIFYSFKHHWYNFWKKDIIKGYNLMKL